MGLILLIFPSPFLFPFQMHGSASEFSRLSLRAVCQKSPEYFLERSEELGIGRARGGQLDRLGVSDSSRRQQHPFISDPYSGMASLLKHEGDRFARKNCPGLRHAKLHLDISRANALIVGAKLICQFAYVDQPCCAV